MPAYPTTFIPSEAGPVVLSNSTDGNQMWSSLVPLLGGGYAAIWTSNNLDGTVVVTENALMARLFDAKGNPLTTEFRLDDPDDGRLAYAGHATGLADGGFAAVWTSYDVATGSYDVGVARFDALGNRIGLEGIANTDTTAGVIKEEPTIASLEDGGFVAVWQGWFQAGDDSFRGVFGQRYDAAGNKVGTEFQVNHLTDLNQSGAKVTGLAGGGFVVIFNDEGYGSPRPILARLYDADGTALGYPFSISGSQTSQDLVYTDVAALPDGGFVAVWQEFYGSNHTIYGAVFDADGTRGMNDFVVASTSGLPYYGFSHFQIQPLSDGSFVVVYSGSDESCVIQHFNGLGVAMGDAVQVDGPGAVADYGHPTIALLDNGDLVVSWSGHDADAYGVFSTVVEAWLLGTSGADVIAGDANSNRIGGREGEDLLQGLGGKDTITGGLDNDDLSGGKGRDRLFGDEGDDDLQGNQNVDHLIGGSGNDLMTGGTGADMLAGQGGNDSLDGGVGDDTLNGGAGDNVLMGGAGSDHFVFTRHHGTDRIQDFEVGVDLIDLRSFGFADADAAKDLAVQVGNVVVFTFASGVELHLHNIDLLTLSDSDFILS